MNSAFPSRRVEDGQGFSRGLLGSTAVEAAFAAAVIAILFLLLCSAVAPSASAGKEKRNSVAGEIALPKKFKGKLPITELTEDEAISHALNRLAYGPRPGDVERIRQMGLEKWVDQQLNPDSIDDSALDARLRKYPTLKMSSKELLEEFPQPNQAARQRRNYERGSAGRVAREAARSDDFGAGHRGRQSRQGAVAAGDDPGAQPHRRRALDGQGRSRRL